MQRKRGPSESLIVRRAGIAAFALLIAASLALTVVACWPRPIPAPAVAAAGEAGPEGAPVAVLATDAAASPPAAATPHSPRSTRAPRSPELPNKFEQAKFHVSPTARPLAPVVTNAPPVGSAEVADDAPSRSRRTATEGAAEGADDPAAAPPGQGVPGNSPEGRPSVSPPE
jgi:hypothetical protein